MKFAGVFLTGALLSAALLSGCSELVTDEERRAALAERGKGPIVVGVVWDENDRDGKKALWLGIDLAAEEISQRGGILGRPLKIEKRGEQRNLRAGEGIALELSENLDVVAVIGHPDARVALATSVMYEYAGIVLLAPGSNSNRLNRPGFRYVFRSRPGPEVFGMHLANLANQRKLGRVLIVYQNDHFGRELANTFEARAEEHRLEIVDRISYETGGARPFVRAVSTVKPESYDAILIAGCLPDARSMLEALRANGIKAPVLVADDLDPSELATMKGGGAPLLAATTFNVGLDRPEVREFVERFEARYSRTPDTWAAQGYDSLHMLAGAIARARSTVPSVIAETLKHTAWRGMTGEHRFSGRGELVGARLLSASFDGKGGFELLPPTATTDAPEAAEGAEEAPKGPARIEP